MPAGLIGLICLLIYVLLAPFIFLEVILISFYKLGIPPLVGLFLVFAIVLCSVINIPIKRYSVEQKYLIKPQTLFGLEYYYPRSISRLEEQILAINLGGAVIPLLIVFYLLFGLFTVDVLFAPLLAILLNIIACFKFSKIRAGVGILIPAFMPGILAAITGLILHPDNPTAVAFCAGVLGPLIGADLMRLKQVRKTGTGIFSIGGAGTFDGIVISGLIAILLT